MIKINDTKRIGATIVRCLVQTLTVNVIAQTYLGIKLLQEGLLGSRHHCVQVGLEGFKLFSQKHTEEKPPRKSH